MIYALIASNLAWAFVAGFLAVSALRERRFWVTLADAWRRREDELLNRIQAPQIAVARSLPEETGPRPYVSAFDDKALAEYEASMTVPKGAD